MCRSDHGLVTAAANGCIIVDGWKCEARRALCLVKIWSITRSVLQHSDRDQVNTEYAYCPFLQWYQIKAKHSWLRRKFCSRSKVWWLTILARTEEAEAIVASLLLASHETCHMMRKMVISPGVGFRPQWWWHSHCCLPSDDMFHYFRTNCVLNYIGDL